MRILVDTNIFLEVVLEQEKIKEAQSFLSETQRHELFISDYSLHSIGLLFFRRKGHDVFRQFLIDMISNAGVKMVAVSAEEMKSVVDAAQKFNLDFDDAYQYATAEKYDLEIVSFDTDFDRTEKGRRLPDKIQF